MKTSLLASLFFFFFVLFSSTSAQLKPVKKRTKCIVERFDKTLQNIPDELFSGIETVSNDLRDKVNVAVEKARTNLQTELDKIAEDKCELGLLDAVCTTQQTAKTLVAVTSVTNTLGSESLGIVADAGKEVQVQLNVILGRIAEFLKNVVTCIYHGEVDN